MPELFPVVAIKNADPTCHHRPAFSVSKYDYKM